MANFWLIPGRMYKATAYPIGGGDPIELTSGYVGYNAQANKVTTQMTHTPVSGAAYPVVNVEDYGDGDIRVNGVGHITAQLPAGDYTITIESLAFKRPAVNVDQTQMTDNYSYDLTHLFVGMQPYSLRDALNKICAAAGLSFQFSADPEA